MKKIKSSKSSISTEKQFCPECSTPLIGVTECREYFNTMILWDFTDFMGAGKVHHLTVLCYYLQHPRHYSVEGLKNAVHILKKVIDNNLSDTSLYKLESDTFSSSQRTWHVTGVQTDHGSYSHEIKWALTVAAVVKDGISKYPEHVKEWANAVYNDLKVAGEFE